MAGCGLMGAGIAEVCARTGHDVVVVESDRRAAEAGRARIEASVARAVERGKLDDPAGVLDRVRVGSDLGAFGDRELVVEAVVEHEPTKAALLGAIGEVLPPESLLATNTSSIPISRLARATGRPDRFLGVHFFNPATVLTLVELVPGLLTSEETLARARAFVVDDLGKHAIQSPDRAGFVVNALLLPYLLAAIRMLEAGVATADDIDQGMIRGAAHPQGPLALADLIGLDTCLAVAESLYAEFKEPLYAPPPLLSRMVDAGLLGRKSGRGFHDYPGSPR